MNIFSKILRTPILMPYMGGVIRIPILSYRAQKKDILKGGVYRTRPGYTAKRILDLGANYGMSIIWFLKTHPSATCIACEPDREIYECLMDNLKRFGLLHRVDCKNVGIWKDSETHIFSANGLGGGSMVKKRSIQKRTCKVHCLSCDHFIDLGKFDIVKMDIEGAENFLPEKWIRHILKSDYVFVEYHKMGLEQYGLGYFISECDKLASNYWINSNGPTVRYSEDGVVDDFENRLNITVENATVIK